MIAPSYSSDMNSDFCERGEKDFQRMFSHMLMAINREMAEVPTPYPLVNSSSNSITIIPAKVN